MAILGIFIKMEFYLDFIVELVKQESQPPSKQGMFYLLETTEAVRCSATVWAPHGFEIMATGLLLVTFLDYNLLLNSDIFSMAK